MRRTKQIFSWICIVALLAGILVFPTSAAEAVEMTADETHNATVGTFVIASDGETKMEAESAKRFWPTAINRKVVMGNSANAGEFSGDGYAMGFAKNPGAYIEYPIQVEKAGTYTLQVRYANGHADKAALEYAIYVDDVQVDNHNYEATTNWKTWAVYEIEVELTTESKSLKFVAGEGTGAGINLDYLSVYTGDKAPDQQPNENTSGMTADEEHNATVGSFTVISDGETKMEAESAKRFWPTTKNYKVVMGNSTNAGAFSGDGYVMGFANNPGAYIEYPIQVQTAGTYTLQVRYANGHADKAALEYAIYVDDVQVDNHNYEATANWKTWDIYEIKINLTADAKSLRFVAGEGTGAGINLDYLAIYAEGTEPDQQPDDGASVITGDSAHNSTVDNFVINPNVANKMEAEAAKRFWPTAKNYKVVMGNSANAGAFSGDGYVMGFANNPGAYIEYPIQIQQNGTYLLRIRYANGFKEALEFAVYVDDELVDTHSYESTGKWASWDVYEIELQLTTDKKSVKFMAGEGVGGGINLDYISIRAKGVEAEQEPKPDLSVVTGNNDHNATVNTFVIAPDVANKMEAEAAKRFWPVANGIAVAMGNKATAGAFSGDGYVMGFANNVGAYIEYPIQVQKAGTYLLRVRYANGFKDALEFSIYVDNELVDNHNYEATGKWIDWGIYEIELELTAGTKSLKFMAGEGVAGGINLDYISLRAKGVEPEEEPQPDLSVIVGNDEHNANVSTFVIAPDVANKMEAESAKRFWPVANGVSVSMNNSIKAGAFSGDGYVMGFANNVGSYIEYPIQVQQAGKYLIRVRYANGFKDALEFSIYLDDELIDNHDYETTSKWTAWGIYEIEVELTEDNKSLKFMAGEGVAGGINLDYISICAEGVEPEEEPKLNIEISFVDVVGDEEHNPTAPTHKVSLKEEVKMEAEDAKRFWLASGSALYETTAHAGYTGDGFAAGFYSNHGAYLEFPVDVQENGTYILRIRYANGSMDSPAFSIYVDDTLVETHEYAPVGPWTNWYSYEVKVELTTENSVVRLVAVPGLADGINVDYVAIRGEGVESKLPVDTLPSIMATTEKHNKGVLPFVVSPNKEVRLEAEDAFRYFRSPGKPLQSNVRYSGYSGTGFIAGFYKNYGAYLEFPLEVMQSGKYTLTVRYANGSVDMPKYNIYLDGELVQTAEFIKSGSWASWSNYLLEIDLTTDAKMLRIEAAPDINNGINIDYLSLIMISEDEPDDSVQIENPALDMSGTNVEPAKDYTMLYIIGAGVLVLLLAVFVILVERNVLFKGSAFFDKLFKR